MVRTRWTDLRMQSAMNRLFSDVLVGPLPAAPFGQSSVESATYYLPVNIVETEDGYRVEAPVPGFRPEDVEITFSDGVLTISVNRLEEQTEQERNYLLREVAFGNYVRHLPLPGKVLPWEIRAAFDRGMLIIDVPTASRSQLMRIPVGTPPGPPVYPRRPPKPSQETGEEPSEESGKQPKQEPGQESGKQPKQEPGQEPRSRPQP